MKKLIHWFPALIIGLFIFSGCDNDLELNADSKDIPVVYGMFSLQDSAYYLRVERVFLEPGEDALELAQQPGQLYYDNILVQLKRSNPEKTVAMERVDGNQEGYKRDEGIFAAAPNYLYKAKASDLQLSAGQTLTLEIDRGEGLPLVTAQTILVETPVWRTTVPSDPINWESGKVTRFSWSYGPETAFFDFRIRVRYEETLPTNPGQKEEKPPPPPPAKGKKKK